MTLADEMKAIDQQTKAGGGANNAEMEKRRAIY